MLNFGRGYHDDHEDAGGGGGFASTTNPMFRRAQGGRGDGVHGLQDMVEEDEWNQQARALGGVAEEEEEEETYAEVTPEERTIALKVLNIWRYARKSRRAILRQRMASDDVVSRHNTFMCLIAMLSIVLMIVDEELRWEYGDEFLYGVNDVRDTSVRGCVCRRFFLFVCLILFWLLGSCVHLTDGSLLAVMSVESIGCGWRWRVICTLRALDWLIGSLTRVCTARTD